MLALSTGLPVYAGTIAISSDVSAMTTPSGLSVSLTIKNSGDEIAHGVTATVSVGDLAPVGGPTRPTLAPGESLTSTVAIPWDEGKYGQWPLFTGIDYADARGYAFQAVKVVPVTRGPATASVVAVVNWEVTPLATSGVARAHLKNLSADPRSAGLRVFAARGLEVSPPMPRVSLEAWGETVVTLEIVNRSLLPGSRLPIFVVAEYDDDDGHHMSLSHAVLEVRPPASRAQPSFIFASVFLILWMIMMAWRRRRRTSQPPGPRGAPGPPLR